MSMIKIPAVLRISDDEPEIPQNFYHELVVWLSLKSLSCYWEVYPEIIATLPDIREAAREALHHYHEQNRDGQVQELFQTALRSRMSDACYNAVTRFLNGAVRVDVAVTGPDGKLASWGMWFSSNQHDPERFRIEPARAVQLAHSYRTEVVKKYNTHDDYVEKIVKAESLDDWDLFIHQLYEVCYEETDRWPESIILITLSLFYRNMLFNQFMRTHVLALSEEDQKLLLDAVRADALETIQVEIENPDPILDPFFPPPDDPKAEVKKIRPAKEVVIW